MKIEVQTETPECELDFRTSMVNLVLYRSFWKRRTALD